ncbi:MAG TPA: DUF599 domain-containing protein [Nevskiaceae bacterium]|nr:DUF599 domain-containing protein [Nevskiaceae bacterium]
MTGTWWEVGATIGILSLYEAWLLIAQRRGREGMTPAAHASLREEWFAAVSAQKGSEILAVQTLRNSLMSATLIASTAVLGLMGALTLTVSGFRAAEAAAFTPRLSMQLGVLALLLASLVASVMAVRYFNHAGYVCGLPVDSEFRRKWAAVGSRYTRKAGLLYSWALRQLVLVMPLVASILHPTAGLVAAVIVVVALAGFDRFEASE